MVAALWFCPWFAVIGTFWTRFSPRSLSRSAVYQVGSRWLAVWPKVRSSFWVVPPSEFGIQVFLFLATMSAATFCRPQQAHLILTFSPPTSPLRTPGGHGSLIWVPSWRHTAYTLMLCSCISGMPSSPRGASHGTRLGYALGLALCVARGHM